MRTLAFIVPLALAAVVAAPATSALASSPIQGGGTCYDVIVGPESNPVIVTVCPPDEG